jgi:hypothetical protein
MLPNKCVVFQQVFSTALFLPVSQFCISFSALSFPVFPVILIAILLRWQINFTLRLLHGFDWYKFIAVSSSLSTLHDRQS